MGRPSVGHADIGAPATPAFAGAGKHRDDPGAWVWCMRLPATPTPEPAPPTSIMIPADASLGGRATQGRPLHPKVSSRALCPGPISPHDERTRRSARRQTHTRHACSDLLRNRVAARTRSGKVSPEPPPVCHKPQEQGRHSSRRTIRRQRPFRPTTGTPVPRPSTRGDRRCGGRCGPVARNTCDGERCAMRCVARRPWIAM